MDFHVCFIDSLIDVPVFNFICGMLIGLFVHPCPSLFIPVWWFGTCGLLSPGSTEGGSGSFKDRKHIGGWLL